VQKPTAAQGEVEMAAFRMVLAERLRQSRLSATSHIVPRMSPEMYAEEYRRTPKRS